MWRSLVACLNGVQEVPGSNPGTPTGNLLVDTSHERGVREALRPTAQLSKSHSGVRSRRREFLRKRVTRASIARLMLLTDKRLDRQCEYRVEKARRFLSQSRFQRPRTEGGDHPDAEEEEGRKEEALDHVVYVERRGRAALPQVCLPL